MVFTYSRGSSMVLTDCSPDGKFMTFFTGVLNLVNLRGEEKVLDRKAIEWLREDYDALDGRFSPDGRYLAFLSNEKTVDKTELYIRPFDPNKPDDPAGPAVQVSENAKMGMVLWRRDRQEM